MLSKLLHRFQPNFIQWWRPPNAFRVWRIKNPRWRTADIWGESKHRHISAAIWPIATKLTHFDPHDCPDRWNLEISKIQDGGGGNLEKWKNRHTAHQRFHRSPRNLVWWHILTLLNVLTVKILKFKNPTWRRPLFWQKRLKNRQCVWSSSSYLIKRLKPQIKL